MERYLNFGEDSCFKSHAQIVFLLPYISGVPIFHPYCYSLYKSSVWCVCVCVYIYLYMEKERERKRENAKEIYFKVAHTIMESAKTHCAG